MEDLTNKKEKILDYKKLVICVAVIVSILELCIYFIPEAFVHHVSFAVGWFGFMWWNGYDKE